MLLTTTALVLAELVAQTCAVDGEDPFTSICTPAKGVSPPAPPSDGTQPGASAQAPYSLSPGPGFQQPLDAGLQSYQSSQVVWLTDPKAAAIPLKPRVKIGHVRQQGSALASFKVSPLGPQVQVRASSCSLDHTQLDKCSPATSSRRAVSRYDAGGLENLLLPSSNNW